MNYLVNAITDVQSPKASCDIFSQLMNHDRIIFLNGEITMETAELIKAQLLFLSQTPGPINMMINSPGGSVADGLAIIDLMRCIDNEVVTICSGQACSMAALILSSGSRRLATPYSEIMIHQMSYGLQGKHSDNINDIERILRIKKTTDQLLADNCGKTPEQIAADTKDDYWMDVNQAINYGIIDEVFKSF
ncbi:MAG: ATP-dependent Clp protease proteolytic subunit [Erysipelotrichaceae bacterium]|nr:ATP-dependent Clp protease proteolytic subunit [Erysipelotrichaceae bacterium]